MFHDSPAFAGFSTNDLDKAREFYGQTLGLEVTDENGMLRLHPAGGGSVLVYPKDDHEPATFTVFNVLVKDIDAAVDQLNALGVELERYAGMEQDARGVMRPSKPEYGPPIAWFKDPAGNVISIIQE